MEVIVNGADRQLPVGQSLAGLLTDRGLDASRVVVELNGRIIPPEDFPQTGLQDRDRLEILQFVTGG